MAPSKNIPDTIEAYQSEVTNSAVNETKLPLPGVSGVLYALKRTSIEFFFEQLLDRAATLTYFTVLTFSPALLAIYSISVLFMADYSADIMAAAEDFMAQFLPPEYMETALDILQTIMGSATGGVIALSIGIATALISSSAYVRAFSRAANSIYRVSEGRPLLKYHLAMVGTTLVMLVGSVLTLVSIALNRRLVEGLIEPIAQPLGIDDFVAFLLDVFFPIWDWLRWPVILIAMMTLIGSLFYFAPNIRQRRFRWLSTGAVWAILSIFVIGKALEMYLVHFASLNPYGAIGAVIAFLIAVWATNAMLLFGFKLDAEVERVRQLRAGYPAEVRVQLPPKAIDAAVGEKKIHQRQRNKAQDILTEEGLQQETLDLK